MPTQGLSLVGFSADQQFALGHLRVDCMPTPANQTDAQLVATWTAAQQALGTPIANAGNVNPQPLNPVMQAYVNVLTATPWVVEQLHVLNQAQTNAGLAPAIFQTVDVDTLLAFQWLVDVDRSQQNCQNLSTSPTQTELLNLCLPTAQPNEPFFNSPVTDQSQSVLIKLRNHNLLFHRWGLFDGPNGAKLAGAMFRVGLPFVHVVRYGGRCYLYNGFHRAYGAKVAGATRIPCLFRDVSNAQMAGINDGTISEAILTGANPPTLSHFFNGRALPVQIRGKSRVLHVTWQQYSVPDEYD